mmetsp:Transcript_22653/g.35453  ORF Transcript_22653/g.35453 Transcript_22653/m.35453 type:complete len:199 (+) Transcript_22653:83-679(+)
MRFTYALPLVAFLLWAMPPSCEAAVHCLASGKVGLKADVALQSEICGEDRGARLVAEGRFAGGAMRLRGGSQPQTNNFEEVGKAFVQHYYNIFDSNRGALQGLYQDMSMLTFEGEKIQGAAAIQQKLSSLPFQTVKHEVITVDSQPGMGGSVLVFVCGTLKVDGESNPMKFSQTFCLVPLQNGQGFFCYNDIFRLNYG